MSDKLKESGSRQLSTNSKTRSLEAKRPVFSVLIRTVECRTSRHAANAARERGTPWFGGPITAQIGDVDLEEGPSIMWGFLFFSLLARAGMDPWSAAARRNP